MAVGISPATAKTIAWISNLGATAKNAVPSLAWKGIVTLNALAWAPFSGLARWVAAPAVYDWAPVQFWREWVITPALEHGIGASGLSIARPYQAAMTLITYEAAKKQFWSKELDVKRAVILSAAALYASQDATVQKIASSAMTPTVLGTLGFCAAVDYANAVAEEGKWVPSVVSEMADKTAKKVKTVYSLASAGVRTAYAKAAAGMEVVREQAAHVAAVAKEKWQPAPKERLQAAPAA